VGGGLIGRVGRVGRHFEQRLRAIAAKQPGHQRGSRRRTHAGGLQLASDAGPIVPAALARGVIVNRTAETVIRLLPPLVITEA